MMISTRGRYALRVLVDIAEHDAGGFIPLNDIAQRQEISEKYLEAIVKILVRGGILRGLRGKGGGYALARAPENIRIGDVLRETEGTLAPVACLEDNALPCTRAAECRTLPMWTGLNRVIQDYLDQYTVADLVQETKDTFDYVI